MFNITVSAAEAAVEKSEIITRGRVGLQCRFRFSPEWKGLAKTAVFSGAEDRDVIITGDTVTVPAECLSEANRPLWVGVCGKSGDGTVVIPTVYAQLGQIEPGACPSGREPAAPTPDVVAQIQQAAANAEAMARSVREDADLGKFNGGQGPQGPAGATGPKGNTGATGAQGPQGPAGDAGADGKSAYAYAVEGGYTGTEEEFAAKLAQEKFANPYALTFAGAVTGSYDGSEVVTVEIPSGGGGEGSFNLIDTYDVSTGALSYETTGLSLNEIVLVIDTAGTWGGQLLYINNTSVGFNAKIATGAVWLRKLASGIFQEIYPRGYSDNLAITCAVPIPGDKIETIKVQFSSATSGIIKIYGR